MNAGRAVVAGLLATLAMTLLFLVEPLLGLPRMDEGGILSTVMSATVAYLPVGFVGGWIIHFGFGVIFALIFALVVAARLPGSMTVRGVLFGLMVFLMAQLVVMPLVGAGLFSGGNLARLTGSLAGHLVYGAVLGWFLGRGQVT